MQGPTAGWHLLYDGVVTPSSAKKLGDPLALKKFCRKLLLELDLTWSQEGEFQASGDASGMSGTCVFAEGTLMIHTRPQDRRLSLDIFSRKKYSRATAEELIADRLGVSQKWVRWFERQWPS